MSRNDYYASCHGITIGSFNLPYNVRVVMLCAENVMTACSSNELKIYSCITSPFGEQLENLNINYNSTDIRDRPPEEYKLCVYSPNFNANYLVEKGILLDKFIDTFNNSKHISHQCPDLKLSAELIRFRSGVYNVPIQYNRIYVNDHISSRTGELIKAGTIEPINTTELFARSYEDKIRGNKALNRLETAIVRPLPSYHSSSHGLSAIRDANDFISSNSDSVMKSIKNTLSLNSVVVPDPSRYSPLKFFRETIPGANEWYLSSIVNDLSEKHPNELVTIMVSACRNKHTDEETYSGIRLEEYASVPIGVGLGHRNIFLKTEEKAKDFAGLTFGEFDQKIFNYVFQKNLRRGRAIPPPPPPVSAVFTTRPSNTFKEKYLKYKNKYLNLLKEINN